MWMRQDGLSGQVKRLLAQVAEETQRPTRITISALLRERACSYHGAIRGWPFHVIVLNSDEGTDHSVAHEAVHLVTTNRAIATDSFVVPTLMLLKDKLAGAFGVGSHMSPRAQECAARVARNAVRHVFNASLDFQVERWLYWHVPEMRETQELSFKSFILATEEKMVANASFLPLLLFRAAGALSYAVAHCVRHLGGRRSV